MPGQALRPIARDDDHLVGDLLQFLLPVEQVSATGFDHNRYTVPFLFERPGNRVNGGNSKAPAHAQHMPKAIDLHRIS